MQTKPWIVTFIYFESFAQKLDFAVYTDDPANFDKYGFSFFSTLFRAMALQHALQCPVLPKTILRGCLQTDVFAPQANPVSKDILGLWPCSWFQAVIAQARRITSGSMQCDSGEKHIYIFS